MKRNSRASWLREIETVSVTSFYVPELNRLYINLSGGDKQDAQVGLQIYQVQP